jgi:hypothetical protein
MFITFILLALHFCIVHSTCFSEANFCLSQCRDSLDPVPCCAGCTAQWVVCCIFSHDSSCDECNVANTTLLIK